MKKITGLLLLIWLAASNAYSEVVVKSTSCGDDMFRSYVDLYFELTDSNKIFSYIDSLAKEQGYDSASDLQLDAQVKRLYESLKRPQAKANQLKKSWLARSYRPPENIIYTPQIGPKNNAHFLEWAKGPKSELSFCTVYLQIYGQIQNQDVQDVKKALEGFANPPFISVSFDSRGGSVDAGIEIGRIIRKHYGDTSISNHYFSDIRRKFLEADKQGNIKQASKYAKLYKNLRKELGITKYDPSRKSRCFSACALAYAGGIARDSGLGDLGVHQHFFTDSYINELSVEEGIANLKKATKLIEGYFDDLDINQDFLQLALSTNADDMHILTMREHRLLLPHVVIEYGNIIPIKKKEHMKTFYQVFSSGFSEASTQFGNKGDLRQILDSVYLEMLKNKEAYRWANFQDYPIRNGKYYQSLSY